MATLPALLLLLSCGCCIPPAPGFLHPREQPRLWFVQQPPSAPGVAKLTTVVTATRVLTEVHLSSCIASTGHLPPCPAPANDDGDEPSPTPQFRLEAIAADHPPTGGGMDPREGGSPPRPAARTFSALQSIFKQMLHPAATPPLLRAPGAADDIVTRTVYVTRRTGEGVPTSTSTVSFTLSGCVPSRMPFPLEPCDEPPLHLRAAAIRPAATEAPAVATATPPQAPSEDEGMLNGPGDEFLMGLQGSEESGSGVQGE